MRVTVQGEADCELQSEAESQGQSDAERQSQGHPPLYSPPHPAPTRPHNTHAQTASPSSAVVTKHVRVPVLKLRHSPSNIDVDVTASCAKILSHPPPLRPTCTRMCIQTHSAPRLPFPLLPINYTLEYYLRPFKFNQLLPVYNTQLLNRYASLDPRVLRLGRFVKCWTRCRGLKGADQGFLGSYAWILQVIQYLKHCGLVPDLENDDPGSI